MALTNPPERMRSPRFPSHPLSDALSYAKKLYDAIHRSPIDSNTAVKIMGFSGKSGASASALGSVRQYGLIEGVGENTKISNLCLQIFEPSSSSEYSQSLRAAAFSPQVFSAISERFAGKIPLVDEPIRSYLIRDLGFSKNGAAECIASMRNTLLFIAQYVTDSEDDSVSEANSSSTLQETLNSGSESPRSPHLSSQSLSNDSGIVTQARFPLTRDCYAEVTLYGEIGARALENLRRQIDFLTEAWTAD